MANKKFTEEEKAKLIDEYRGSGLSMSAFCEKKGEPSYPTFSKWVKSYGSIGSVSAASSGSYDGKLYGEFTQTLIPDDADKRYIRFLEGKVKELEVEVARLLREGKEG